MTATAMHLTLPRSRSPGPVILRRHGVACGDIAGPLCASDMTFFEGLTVVCNECDHEWVPGDAAANDAAADATNDEAAIKDSMGNVLANGDSVVTIRDLIADGKAVRAVRASLP